jgi:hypothetical protein
MEICNGDRPLKQGGKSETEYENIFGPMLKKITTLEFTHISLCYCVYEYSHKSYV